MYKNNNYIQLKNEVFGEARKNEILNEPLKNSTFLPNTLSYQDIDKSFKEWVSNDLKIVDNNGKFFPTLSLYTNQRFSEYAQTWNYTDSNNNILLNFKTITRDNNPQYGKIQNGLYNIPGDIFFTMKREIVLDDNGNESLRILKMKQPVAIDLIYKVSLFTNEYQSINKFNTKINTLFAGRQVYINPNGYYIPMTLESVDDESTYNIDDRQFYSQTYGIKVMGYIIPEEHFRVEESPLKFGFSIDGSKKFIKKPEVEIEECETSSPYYYKPIILTINYPVCRQNYAQFTIDTNFTCDSFESVNLLNKYRIFVNDEEIPYENGFTVKNGDLIKIIVKKKLIDKAATLILNGHSDIVYDENLDNPDIEENNKQYTDIYEIESE